MTAKAVAPRMLTTQQLCQYIGLSRNQAVAFSKRIGACRQISSRKNLHDRLVLDKALDEQAAMLVPQEKRPEKEKLQ